jgi:hypothetical protein
MGFLENLQPARLPLQSIVIKDRPRRLDRIFSHAPLFFVTFCTRNRKRIDPLVSAHSAFVKYGKGAKMGIRTGQSRARRFGGILAGMAVSG